MGMRSFIHSELHGISLALYATLTTLHPEMCGPVDSHMHLRLCWVQSLDWRCGCGRGVSGFETHRVPFLPWSNLEWFSLILGAKSLLPRLSIPGFHEQKLYRTLFLHLFEPIRPRHTFINLSILRRPRLLFLALFPQKLRPGFVVYGCWPHSLHSGIATYVRIYRDAL